MAKINIFEKNSSFCRPLLGSSVRQFFLKKLILAFEANRAIISNCTFLRILEHTVSLSGISIELKRPSLKEKVPNSNVSAFSKH